jgi:hypothetical protein
MAALQINPLQLLCAEEVSISRSAERYRNVTNVI